MTQTPFLSILIPATPKRYHTHLWPLWNKLQGQVDSLQREGLVELLVFLDNRMRTIGAKRDALVQTSRGRFVAFCDDDDDVADDYVAELIGAIERAPEEVSVITFDQNVSVNGVKARCSFSINNRNEPFAQPSFKRSAWHVCAWRGSMARKIRFPETNYGEDWAWARHLVIDAQAEIHLDKILHSYRYDERISEAPAP